MNLVDINPAALERTKNSIYPGRYGQWDKDIQLFQLDEAPQGGYDLRVIGTPPDQYIELALAALEELPKAILVEKPICGPDMKRVQELMRKANDKSPVNLAYPSPTPGKRAVCSMPRKPGVSKLRPHKGEYPDAIQLPDSRAPPRAALFH